MDNFDVVDTDELTDERLVLFSVQQSACDCGKMPPMYHVSAFPVQQVEREAGTLSLFRENMFASKDNIKAALLFLNGTNIWHHSTLQPTTTQYLPYAGIEIAGPLPSASDLTIFKDQCGPYPYVLDQVRVPLDSITSVQYF